MDIKKYLQKDILKQICMYLIVGGSSALIELFVFWLLREVFDQSIIVSNVSAIILSTTYNFLLSRGVTFKSTSNIMRSLILYLILFAFNTTFSTIVIYIAESCGLPGLVGKIIAMACIVSWNFILYRKVIFK